MNRITRQHLTSARLTRPGRGAVAGIALALLLTAPAAAAQPTRTIYPSQPVSHYRAGTGCAFDVTAYKLPGAQTTEIDFSDGTIVFETHSMHRRIVNDATGAVYEENLESHEVDRVDNAGIDHGTINGQFIYTFLPGDVGPDGVVLDHVVSLDIVGRATYVVGWYTGVTLAVTIVGQTTDICAAIS